LNKNEQSVLWGIPHSLLNKGNVITFRPATGFKFKAQKNGNTCRVQKNFTRRERRPLIRQFANWRNIRVLAFVLTHNKEKLCYCSWSARRAMLVNSCNVSRDMGASKVSNNRSDLQSHSRALAMPFDRQHTISY